MNERYLPELLQQTAYKNITVGGNFSSGNTVQNIGLYQSEFSVPNLEAFNPEKFLSPCQSIINELLQHLERHQLIVLDGGDDINKSDIARGLAWYLRANLLKGNQTNASSAVKEWQRGSEPLNLEAELLANTTPTIYILNKIAPQDVDYDVSRVRNAARHNHHHVITSTDLPRNRWKLAEKEQVFWCAVSAEGLYDLEKILEELKHRLRQQPGNLVEDIKRLRHVDVATSDDSVLQPIAAKLQTPDRISNFVQLLALPLQNEGIEKLIDLAQDSQKFLNRWFHVVLQPREQLIALGLNFFDGLFDDQCLAAIGELVKYEWYRREPSLKALDHGDLECLHNFFKLKPEANQVKRIESYLPNQRFRIFETAWDSYRLRIQTALPVLVNLVKNSVDKSAVEKKDYGVPIGKHLYGGSKDSSDFYSNKRGDQLRQAVSEAISDLGLINSYLVQDALFELAADKDVRVQAVAARAIARWHDPNYGNDKKFFGVLNSLSERSKALKSEQASDGKLKDYILATIAIAVAYASKHNKPNELSQELHTWLRRIVDYKSKVVTLRLRDRVLRTVAPLHCVQIQSELYVLAQDESLTKTLGYSLELAYRRDAKGVYQVLKKWHSICTDSQAQSNQPYSQNHIHKIILAVIALTCTKNLWNQNENQPIDKENSQLLTSILSTERHLSIRQKVMDEVRAQIRKSFQQSEKQIRLLVEHLKIEEHNDIIEELATLYDQQKQQGSSYSVIKQNGLPLWLASEPKTAVETIMFKWLRENGNTTAQTIGAVLALGKPIDFNEILAVLSLWNQKSSQYQSVGAEEEPANHEFLLTAIALIAIRTLTSNNVNQPNKLSQLVGNILTKEQHTFIRSSIIHAISYQIQNRFKRIVIHLRDWIPNLNISERKYIMESIAVAHFQQCERATDDLEAIYQNYLPVWWTKKWKLTLVEEEMHKWLIDPSNIVAQEVGAQLLLGYPLQTDQVLPTLNLWYEKYTNFVPHSAGQEVSNDLLIAIALLSLNVMCSSAFTNTQTEQAFQLIHKLLKARKHPSIRETIVRLICHYVRCRFLQVELAIKRLLKELSIYECEQVQFAIANFHKQQLADLGKSDTSVSSEKTPFWWHLGRPPIDVEKVILGWLISEEDIAAQMIGAGLSLGNIENLDEVLSKLELWCNICKSISSQAIEREENRRQVLLASVAVICIKLLCNKKTDKVVAAKALSYLDNIFAHEYSSFVRRTAVSAICYGFSQNFDQLELYFKNLTSRLQTIELEQVLKFMPEDYFNENQSTSSSTVFTDNESEQIIENILDTSDSENQFDLEADENFEKDYGTDIIEEGTAEENEPSQGYTYKADSAYNSNRTNQRLNFSWGAFVDLVTEKTLHVWEASIELWKLCAPIQRLREGYYTLLIYYYKSLLQSDSDNFSAHLESLAKSYHRRYLIRCKIGDQRGARRDHQKIEDIRTNNVI